MSDQGAARNVEGTASGDEDKEGETEMLWASRRFFVLVSSLIRRGARKARVAEEEEVACRQSSYCSIGLRAESAVMSTDHLSRVLLIMAKPILLTDSEQIGGITSLSRAAHRLKPGGSFAVRRRTKTMNWGPVTFRFSD
ncbi:hypothetical protein BHE74_00015828 [Ensete ventricosum]|nr:hypothetical protein BHE74_00015828 [Ensete ventricosum]